MKQLTEALTSALKTAGLQHARLLCAVSGGADSVALLHAASRVRAACGYQLEAVYVQHGLRGENSLADEAFVKQLCEQLCVKLHILQAQLSGTMHDPGAETRARDERRRLFAQAMRSTQADALLVAHHQDDQAETVLMHLLRGSGGRGLTGMRKTQPFAGGLLIRPFLQLTKQQLTDALREADLSWREDESNACEITPRNALRIRVLPQLETLYPHAGQHIAQAAQTLAVDEGYLSEQAQALFETNAYAKAPVFAIARQPLQAAHPALARRALRMLYACVCPESAEALSLADTLALENLLHAPNGTAINLPGGIRASAQEAHLHLAAEDVQTCREEPGQPLRSDACSYDFDHAAIRQLQAGPDEAIPASAQEVILSPAVLSLAPVLRLPRRDDVIRPLGAPGHKALRRFWTDRKIDPHFRWRLPVLAAGKEILWIPSVCIAEALRLQTIPDGSIRLKSISHIPLYPHQIKE